MGHAATLAWAWTSADLVIFEGNPNIEACLPGVGTAPACNSNGPRPTKLCLKATSATFYVAYWAPTAG